MSTEKMKIFIAEDDVIIRMTLRMILEKHGYEVIGEAEDGQKAIEGIDRTMPDLVLMDINMPVVDGFTVIERIRPNHQVPVVIITGYYKQEFVERSNQLGVFAYLMKPVDENQIAATVEIAKERYQEFLILQKEIKSSKMALEQRKYVERAKGIIMEQKGISESEAMKFLQRRSRNKNQKLIQVAKEVIQAAEVLGD